MSTRYILIILLAALLIPSQSGYSETNTQSSGLIQKGMSFAEVIKAKGAPIEKTERETSRITYWRYADEVVEFKDGVVSGLGNAKNSAAARSRALGNSPEKAAARVPRGSTRITQEVVDDIINAIPNDGSVPSTRSGGSDVPPGRMIPNDSDEDSDEASGL